MDAITLSLLGVVGLGAGAAAARRWRREHRLETTECAVHCPLHRCPATVSVQTDPEANSRYRYLGVSACSIASDVAIALPERVGYLPDSPACRVVLDPPASHTIHASGVACAQDCVFVLNHAGAGVTAQPLGCSSGVNDAVDLMRQVDGQSSARQVLWHSSY